MIRLVRRNRVLFLVLSLVGCERLLNVDELDFRPVSCETGGCSGWGGEGSGPGDAHCEGGGCGGMEAVGTRCEAGGCGGMSPGETRGEAGRSGGGPTQPPSEAGSGGAPVETPCDAGGCGGAGAGGAGEDLPEPCRTQRDCWVPGGKPRYCREQRCVRLTNDEGSFDTPGGCRLVLGRENLDEATPLFVFGAFSVLNGLEDLEATRITKN